MIPNPLREENSKGGGMRDYLLPIAAPLRADRAARLGTSTYAGLRNGTTTYATCAMEVGA
jgi:hypothetical protein